MVWLHSLLLFDLVQLMDFDTSDLEQRVQLDHVVGQIVNCFFCVCVRAYFRGERM